MTSGDVPLQAVGDDRTLKVTVDTRVVARVIARAPKIAHFWLQGFLSRAMVNHRVAWLRSKGTKFGRRGKDGSRAVKVYRVNEGPASPRPEDVVYRVFPGKQRASSVAEAVRGLREMGGEAFAGSTVLRVHEFGEDIRSTGRLMAIPVKTRPGTPKAWLAKNPGKQLELIPSKTKPGEGRLFEVTRSRRRGRPRKGASMPALRKKYRLRFILTRFVEMDPTLDFYGSWDRRRAERDRLWKGAADRMEKQLQKGDPRDF